MVGALHIVAGILVRFQVGYCLDFSAFHLHKYCRAPFGFRFHTHVVEFLFNDVLDFHVDGGLYVVAAFGRNGGIAGHFVGELNLLCLARFSVKQAVECHLKPRYAMYKAVSFDIHGVALDFGHTAYASRCHLAVGLYADGIHFRIQEIAVLADIEKREFLKPLIFAESQLAGNAVAALALRAFHLGAEALFPVFGILFGEHAGKAVAQRSHVFVNRVGTFHAFHSPVEPCGVVVQVAGKQSAVRGIDVASFGRHNIYLGENFVGLLVPIDAVHHGGVDEFVDYTAHEQHDADNHQHVARNDVAFVLLFHSRLSYLLSLSTYGGFSGIVSRRFIASMRSRIWGSRMLELYSALAFTFSVLALFRSSRRLMMVASWVCTR